MDKQSLNKELTRVLYDESEYLISSYSSLYQRTISEMLKPLKNIDATKVVAIDMKGLLYGPIIAHKLRLPFVPLLKGSKIRYRSLVVKGTPFVDYSGTKKSVELFKQSITKGDKVILIDDWFESGNTGKSAIKLIEKLGGKVVCISVVFNQLCEKDETFFRKYNFTYIVRLDRNKKKK